METWKIEEGEGMELQMVDGSFLSFFECFWAKDSIVIVHETESDK